MSEAAGLGVNVASGALTGAAVGGPAGAAVGAGIALVGGVLGIGGARKRRKAERRAQQRLEEAAKRYWGERRERSDALADVFQSLADERGQTIQQFLTDRMSETRAEMGRQHAGGLAGAIQAAQGALTTPQAFGGGTEQMAQSEQAQFGQYAPTLDAATQAALEEARFRGFGVHEQGLERFRDLDLSGLNLAGQHAGIISGMGTAELDTAYSAEQRELAGRLARAGQAGDNLALLGGLTQQVGMLGMNVAAMRPQAPGPQAPVPPEGWHQYGREQVAPFRGLDY